MAKKKSTEQKQPLFTKSQLSKKAPPTIQDDDSSPAPEAKPKAKKKSPKKQGRPKKANFTNFALRIPEDVAEELDKVLSSYKFPPSKNAWIVEAIKDAIKAENKAK